MATRIIDYLIRVHTLPHDLMLPLPAEREYLADVSMVYQFAIDSRVLWKIAQFDEWGFPWIEVSFENDEGDPEFHLFRVDEGSYSKVEDSEYEVEVEESSEH